MTQQHQQGRNMAEIRQRLREAREAQQGSAAASTKPSMSQRRQAYIPPRGNTGQKQIMPERYIPADNNPHVRRAPSFADQIEKHKPLLHHLHLYWHVYITAFIFLLFHTVGAFPQYFPGTGNMESLHARAPFIALFLCSLPSVAAFFMLKNLRKSLQLAGRVTESTGWTAVEWIGAAIGFAIVFYRVFYHTPFLEQYMIEEAIKGPFELTPREWIMAGVKCVGGGVFGAIIARKFFV